MVLNNYAVRIQIIEGLTATLNKSIKPNNSVKRILDYEKRGLFSIEIHQV